MTQPSLFDFQINGFGGVDFQRHMLTRDEFEHVATALRRHKVAGIFVTLITDNIETLCRRLENFEQLRREARYAGSIVLGYHLEGPWLSPEPGYRGAHPHGPMHAPNKAEFDRLQDAAGGNIRLVTLAPEWPGSPEFITQLTGAGVHVSLGHTNASDAEIDSAIVAGARFCTHLGNGTPIELHRHNNIIQRLLARDELTACFIPDGVHLPAKALRNFFRSKPSNRVLFTTDAMAGAGAPPARYTLGGIELDVGLDGIARHPSGQGFAGSALTPDEGVRRTAYYLGISVESAFKYWSTAATQAFGVELPKE